MSDITETTAAASQAFDRTVADLKQNVETATAAHAEASEKAFNTAKTIAAFNQGNLEAFTSATQLMATGSQDLVRSMADSAKTAFAEYLSSMRAIVTARTAKDRVELQTQFIRAAATWSVAESSRFAHAGIELIEKATAPLVARATLAADTFTPKA